MSVFPKFKPAPSQGGYREDNMWVWCGSAVEEPGKGYHLYASRWRKDYPMLPGYIFFSEIVHAFSETLEGPYHFVEKVLPCHEPSAWDGRMAHNPTVVRCKDEYLMFYIGSTYPGEATPPDLVKDDQKLMFQCYEEIRIGMARSRHPGGPWEVLPQPVLEARPGHFDCTIVTNPAPCVLPDGRIYLYYRTNTVDNKMAIGLAVADRPEGPYRRGDKPAIENVVVEDPFVWHNGKNFEMLAKDMNGSATGEVHAGALFISDDGLNWQCEGKAYSRKVRFDNGEEIVLGSLERPQVLFDGDGRPQALFAAVADGPGGFRQASKTWNQVFPLEVRKEFGISRNCNYSTNDTENENKGV